MVGQPAPREPRQLALEECVRETLARALAQMRHGYITLVVQDGKIVQIDLTEKVRFEGVTQATGGALPRRRAGRFGR